MEQTSLNWEQIEHLLEDAFQREEAELLRLYYGIRMDAPVPEKELAKAVGKKGKKLALAVEKAKGRLFRLLKEEELNALLLIQREQEESEKGEV